MRNAIFTLAALALVLAASLAAAPAAQAEATPVFEGAIWEDGTLWGTVLTPALLPDDAPEDSFDVIYNFAGAALTGQRSVSEAAPGDADYNGGRWSVLLVDYTEAGVAAFDTDGDGDVDGELTSDEAVLMAANDGLLTLTGPVLHFSCPLVPTR